MALQSSGAISIGNIRSELGMSTGSLRSLSAAAGKGTSDSMSEFYGFNASNLSVWYGNDETSFGGDANLRIYAWDNNGNNILSEWWVWGTQSGNLGSDTGITFKSGYTIQIYAINWGSSTQRLYVYNQNGMMYDSCAWSEVGPYTFTVYPNNSYNINCVSNYC